MRVPDQGRQCIGYRLKITGVRVWNDRCQLVAKDRSGDWQPIGPIRALPVYVPKDPSGIESDPLIRTAYQYDVEHPGSDLVAVLSQRKPFEQAILYDVDLSLDTTA